MRRIAHILAAALALVAISASTAWACSCLRAPDAESHLAGASVMFSGYVQSTKVDRQAGGSAVTRIRVVRTLKGRPLPVRVVRHGTDPAACGIAFRRGQFVTVLASASKDGLRLSLCGSTPQFPLADYERAARLRR